MPSWGGYVVAVLVIFVLIAPSQVLGPVFGALHRFVGPGVAALILAATGGWILLDDPSERARLIGDGELALAALCAVCWVYRCFVPRYRDQAPASEPVGDDR